MKTAFTICSSTFCDMPLPIIWPICDHVNTDRYDCKTEKRTHEKVRTHKSDFVRPTENGPTLTCAVRFWHFIGWP